MHLFLHDRLRIVHIPLVRMVKSKFLALFPMDHLPSKSCLLLYSHYYYHYHSFSHQLTLMVFHWSLSDRESPQVSRTLLSILAVLNNTIVWMVTTRPPTSRSSSPFSNPLVTVSNTPITIGIIVTCIFHSFFNSLARSRYLSFFSHSFSFIQSRLFCKFSFFFVDYY